MLLVVALYTHAHDPTSLHGFDEDHAPYNQRQRFVSIDFGFQITGLVWLLAVLSTAVISVATDLLALTRVGATMQAKQGRVALVTAIGPKGLFCVWLLIEAMTAHKAISALQACKSSHETHKQPLALLHCCQYNPAL